MQSLPQGITALGHFRQRAGADPASQIISEGYERVELVTAGRGWVLDEGEWIEVVPGDLLWHVPGDQTIGRSDHDDPYQCLNIIFRSEGLSGRRVERLTHWPDLDRGRELMREALRMWVDDSFPRSALNAFIYGNLIAAALRGRHLHARSRLPLPVRAAREFMERNYPRRITLEQLAGAAGCSVPYLHELFNRHCASSPHQELLRLRLREACRRLASTDDPIKRIAAETGFAHASAFSHAFRMHYGVTPAAYRERALAPFTRMLQPPE